MSAKEFLKTIRACANGGDCSVECPYYFEESGCCDHEGLMKDAATIIEELMRIAWQAEAYKEAVEPLMPKQGEWIHSTVVQGTTVGGVTVEHQYTCSVCGALMGRKGDKYCYRCGAKMGGERNESD